MGFLSHPRKTEPAPFEHLREKFDRALENLWHGRFDLEELSAAGDWVPRVDIAETDDAMEVEVDLPGIDPKDVDISLSNNELTIKGQREEKTETKDQAFHRIERSYGSFYRRIALPSAIDSENVTATAEHGVIKITVPKRPEAKSRPIQVKAK